MATPRVVVVHRTTQYDEVIARHGTRGQAAFFLHTRSQSLDAVQERHRLTVRAIRAVDSAIPVEWRRARVERADLPAFVFGPDDVIVVVGQDGLVANLAKYLHDQPVIGIDPLPGVNAGVLVPHPPQAAADLLHGAVTGRGQIVERTMVQADSDDGQHLIALNEIYIGQPTHQSARYRLRADGIEERQSSSGIIVATGTGSTGWCRSIQRIQAPRMPLPEPADPRLIWFVREPWPSPSTGADLLSGTLTDSHLTVHVESDSLVTFGDGIEADRITLGWGQELRIHRAGRVLRTLR